MSYARFSSFLLKGTIHELCSHCGTSYLINPLLILCCFFFAVTFRVKRFSHQSHCHFSFASFFQIAVQLVAFSKNAENWSPINADDIVLLFQLRNTQLWPDLITSTNIFLFLFWINMWHLSYSFSFDVKTIAAGPDVTAILCSITRTMCSLFSSKVALLRWHQ